MLTDYSTNFRLYLYMAILALLLVGSKQYAPRSGVTRGEANGQLPISFGDLPIVIFISKFLPIEILLFQSCLLIFELDSNCIFSIRLSLTYILCLFFLRRIKKSRRIPSYILTYVFFLARLCVCVYFYNTFALLSSDFRTELLDGDLICILSVSFYHCHNFICMYFIAEWIHTDLYINSEEILRFYRLLEK